jgi:cobalt-zinc-cadmium efflux system outer membrane protein
MLVGTYQLLETRTDQIDARQEYVEALRDYWVARSELELAVGGRLPAGGA